ncbi:CDP-diacylglycerol--glycerol-3-phosphate 3-phosphatidyltransferase [Celerinatantimonas sp. MCCC 1A17872]|uniref:CDP-diacylglycerol--glycerol-3-phosphate 3-phosphatidyltransferase n=1 Tax=Celerinatantimonas sp. MCCC 1A17872 TaxID=3177514 RepID=UPI0038BF3A71
MNTIPNILTVFRLFLIPFFLVAFYIPVHWAYFASAAIFVVAAVTDYFDGFLARRLKQTSPFGAFLDPVADKVMVTTTLVVLVEHYDSIWISLPAMVVIGREVVISALREWMAELGSRASVAVSKLGKYKTAAQMTAITGLLWQYQPWMVSASKVLLYIAVVLTIWSMVSYLRAAWPFLTGQKKSNIGGNL